MSGSRTVQEVQQDLAVSSGLRSEIIWDLLCPDQSDILKEKIIQLFPDVQGNRNMKIFRQNLFNSIWQQRKYTNHNLLSAIIYVLVSDCRMDEALSSTSFSWHPVFRTRKCINQNNSRGCCMIFVDEHGRVYTNWGQYLQENTLPKGIMIAPANGVYTFNENDEVLLETNLTPASSKISQIKHVTDIVTSVSGIAAAVPLAAAALYPVAAPVIATATAVTLTTAAYSTIRSAMHLKDRRKHEQSIALKNNDARKAWVGVAVGAIGLGATGATKALSLTTLSVRNAQLATAFVNGINVSSIIVSGSGIVHDVIDIYVKLKDDDKINSLDVLQLASSLIIFTHSINNLKVATKINEGAKNGESIRTLLKNRLRNLNAKIMDKNIVGVDKIRNANDIPVRNTLMALHTLNPNLNAELPTGAIGTISLPNIIRRCLNTAGDSLNLFSMLEEFGPQFVQHINNTTNFLDILYVFGNYFCERTTIFLMNLAKTFIEYIVSDIEISLNNNISTEHILYKMIMRCVLTYSNFSYEYLHDKTGEILHYIENYFRSLTPIGNSNSRVECKNCGGYYYLCA